MLACLPEGPVGRGARRVVEPDLVDGLGGDDNLAVDNLVADSLVALTDLLGGQADDVDGGIVVEGVLKCRVEVVPGLVSPAGTSEIDTVRKEGEDRPAGTLTGH